MKRTVVTCDRCKKEITETNNGRNEPAFESAGKSLTIDPVVKDGRGLAEGVDLCRHCIIDIFNSADDRPKKAN